MSWQHNGGGSPGAAAAATLQQLLCTDDDSALKDPQNSADSLLMDHLHSKHFVACGIRIINLC